MTEPNLVESPKASFEEAAAMAMSELNGALARLLAGIDEPVRRAVDLERALELDGKLAWQVFRIANAETPLDEVGNVPSRLAMQRLVTAASNRGVAEPVSRGVMEALDRFEHCVTQHGGDREGLLSLVHGVPSQQSAAFHLKVRKALFPGQAHIWGVQARALLRTAITPPVAPGQPVKWVLLSGNIGIQRLRGDSPVTISSWMRRHTTEGKMASDSTDDDLGIEIVEEFCSKPLPRIMPTVNFQGSMQMELALPQTGLAGATTMYIARAQENAADARVRGVTEQMVFTTPTQEVVFDIMVPAGWTNPATARVGVYGCRLDVHRAFSELEADRMPQQETIKYLGVMETVPPVAASSRHPDAVRYVLKKYGCLGVKFDVYRCRVQYPALHTAIAMHVDPAGHSSRASESSLRKPTEPGTR